MGYMEKCPAGAVLSLSADFVPGVAVFLFSSCSTHSLLMSERRLLGTNQGNSAGCRLIPSTANSVLPSLESCFLMFSICGFLAVSRVISRLAATLHCRSFIPASSSR